MNADPFGHNAMLPQILRGQGMDSYTFLRPGPHEGDLEPSTFWWEAPDGSRVLAYRIPNEYGSGPGAVDGQLEKAIAAARQAGEMIMVFYGVGNHGGGPTRANLDSIRRFDRMGSFGRLTLSSPRDYLDAVLAQVEAGRELPVRRDDLQHHAPGCYSAHSGHQGLAAASPGRGARGRTMGGAADRRCAPDIGRSRCLPAGAARVSLEAGAVQPVPRRTAGIGHRGVVRRRPGPARRGGGDRQTDHHPGPQRDRPADRHPVRGRQPAAGRLQPAPMAGAGQT